MLRSRKFLPVEKRLFVTPAAFRNEARTEIIGITYEGPVHIGEDGEPNLGLHLLEVTKALDLAETEIIELHESYPFLPENFGFTALAPFDSGTGIVRSYQRDNILLVRSSRSDVEWFLTYEPLGMRNMPVRFKSAKDAKVFFSVSNIIFNTKDWKEGMWVAAFKSGDVSNVTFVGKITSFDGQHYHANLGKTEILFDQDVDNVRPAIDEEILQWQIEHYAALGLAEGRTVSSLRENLPYKRDFEITRVDLLKYFEPASAASDAGNELVLIHGPHDWLFAHVEADDVATGASIVLPISEEAETA